MAPGMKQTNKQTKTQTQITDKCSRFKKTDLRAFDEAMDGVGGRDVGAGGRYELILL